MERFDPLVETVDQFGGEDQHRSQADGPLAAIRRLLRHRLHPDQHDDEEIQHHDPAHIKDDLHGEEKLRVLKQENSAH